MKINIEEIQFVKELYPRLREDNAAIERYRAAIDRLPAIIVARGRVLVDGFHRWQAFRREGFQEVDVEDLGNLTDAEIIRESIQRNATHGQQLSAADKRRLAGQLWQTFAHLDGERVPEIARLLSVSDDSVQRWTKEARANEQAVKQVKAFDLWLDCKSDVEIGETLGVTDKTAKKLRSELAARAEFSEPPASRQHFDVWSFQTADGESSYFGKMPPQVVENLLWFYTEPGDIVFDPFAGGGTTIDIAKLMGRRVWTSDLTPSTPTLPIHKHDITVGWPNSAPKKVNLILLDPPYWQQAKGRYSKSQQDFGNMTLENFKVAWSQVLKACTTHLTADGHLAFIISPSVDGESVVDHAFEMYEAAVQEGFKPLRRVIVTYNTQQATGQQVTWARDNKQLLKLYRDLVIFTA